MVNVPERAYQDMVDLPEQRLTAATTALTTAQTSLAGSQKALDALKAQKDAKPEDIAAAEQALKTSQDALAKATTDKATAEKQKTSLGSQWDIMRDDVFGTGKKETGAMKDLSDAGSKKDPKQVQAILDDFKANSRRAATPQQLEKMKMAYLQQINAIP